MFEVIEKATGKRLNVYAVDGDRFVVGTDTGFEFQPMALFAPATAPSTAEAPEKVQDCPCMISVTESRAADLDAALADLASGKVPAALGSTISTRLLDGTEVDLVMTDFDDKTIRLESRDCLGINTSANDLKAYLDRVYALLPEALKKRIVEVERHHLDYKGKKFTDRCKLFVPAASEVFPPEDCYGDKGLYEQMEWYKDVHNRMRADCKRGDSHWYWLSSPFSDNSYYFCRVGSGGTANYYAASGGRGLAPFGCIISKI